MIGQLWTRIKALLSEFGILSESHVRIALKMNIAYYTEKLMPLISSRDPGPAIDFLKKKEILAQDMVCRFCKNDMLWDCTNFRGKKRYTWRCTSRRCDHYGTRVSFTKGSTLFGTKLSAQTWLQIIYSWSEKMSVNQTSRMTGRSRITISTAFKKLQSVTVKYFVANPVKLGGPGIVVECDESLFSYKPKHHRGRAPGNQCWVFGMVDRSYKPARGWMEVVERKDMATLLPLIEQHVRRGSIVHTDGLATYQGVRRIPGLSHRWVNHKKNFVDPKTGVHTQAIESYWAKHKYTLKCKKGIRQVDMPSFLKECIWRDRFQFNAFNIICRHIADYWSI